MYSGISPIFFQQLETSKDKDYIPVVIMCLGNLCGEDKCRNILVNDRLISIILSLLNRVISLSFFLLFVVYAQSGDYGELFILFEERLPEDPHSAEQPEARAAYSLLVVYANPWQFAN